MFSSRFTSSPFTAKVRNTAAAFKDDTDSRYKIESNQVSRSTMKGGEISAECLAVDVSAYADRVRGWSDIAASISLQTASIKAIDRTSIIQKKIEGNLVGFPHVAKQGDNKPGRHLRD